MVTTGLNGVWSERDEPNTSDHSWRDCTYATALMMLYGAGFRAFPLGAYTVNEREAFERSDNAPDENGGNFVDVDAALDVRYHLLPFRQFPVGMTIEQMLQTNGNLIGLLGNNGVFPYGDPWRRYSVNFDGNHTICFVSIGSQTQVWKMDPLAPWNDPGEIVDIAKVLKWAIYGVSPFYTRFIQIGDIASLIPVHPVNPMGGFPVQFKSIVRNGVIAAGVNVRTSPYLLGNTNRVTTTTAPVTIGVLGEVPGDAVDGNSRWFTYWYPNTATTNVYDGRLLYVHSSLVTLK